MYIDTHCHLSIEDYDDVDKVISDNMAAGVNKIIISACEKKNFEEAIELSNKYNFISLSMGYHPDCASTISDADIIDLERLMIDGHAVALGEIGLDYHYGNQNRDDQIKLFEAQLQLAEKLNLPVVIHSRDAVQDTIDTIKKYKVRGVIHCFSGSLEVAEIYVKLGFLIGIGGVVTFKNSNLYKVVEKIGLENIVLETDSPYLTPAPFRGQKNSSKYIPIIAQKIADICNVPPDEVAKITSLNASNMFDL